MDAISSEDRNAFSHAFLVCLLWSTAADGEHEGHLDDSCDLEDIHPNTAAGLRQECDAFLEANWADINTVMDEVTGYTCAQAGHDFALSRNGHGTGFFDCGSDEAGERLQKAAEAVGAAEAYVGDDGLVYVSGLERFGEGPARASSPRP